MKITTKQIEICVGFFMLLACAAFLFLMMKVANISTGLGQKNYQVFAEFDNIGSLKVGSPIKVGGVVVGEVGSIELNQEAMMPVVRLDIEQQYNQFPENSSIAILTSGLLGAQYIAILPGFIDDDTLFLKQGDMVYETNSAIILEDLIGQFLYSMKPE